MWDAIQCTEDQRSILETIKKFVDDEVRPRAAELDAQKNPEDGFSLDILKKADELGIRTMTLSDEWGGLGLDSLTTAMVIEELARGDIGVSVTFAQTLKIAQIMEKALTAEQKARVLPAFVEDPIAMLAIGITEPTSG